MQEIDFSDGEFGLFRELIYKLTGISLSDAKKHLVRGRLQKRLRARGCDTYRAYYNLAVHEGPNSDETRELINCVTTNKTDFFREPHHFDFVRNRLVPEMVAKADRSGSPTTLTAWHAGCSTGEEPYTLGITLSEALEQFPGWSYRQFASDIDTNVISHAERGIYDAERVETVPPKLLSKYFLRSRTQDESLRYKVRPELQEPITWRQVNLTADDWPINPRARFDMIFCRNVIIYFDKPTKQRLFKRFQQFLKPDGYLFIGHSESLHGVSDDFENLGQTIYRQSASHGLLRRAA